MKKYSIAIRDEAEKWVSEHGLVDYGGGLLKNLCKLLGITYTCFDNWMKRRPDFKAAINRGKEAFKKSLSHDLTNTLADAARGGYREEEKERTEYIPGGEGGSPQIRLMVKEKTKRFIKPDVGAAIFLLTNLDPEHYQNRQRTDLTLAKKEDEEQMSLEEINKEIERLEKLDK